MNWALIHLENASENYMVLMSFKMILDDVQNTLPLMDCYLVKNSA